MDAISSLMNLAKSKDPINTIKIKTKKRKLALESTADDSKLEEELEASAYNFPVCDDDHCESPVEAYEDISFFLEKIGNAVGKSKENLIIFDPYYCEGDDFKLLSYVLQISFAYIQFSHSLFLIPHTIYISVHA